MNGQTIITAVGLNLLANGQEIKPKKFKFSDEEVELSESLTDLNGWIYKDIDNISILNNNTIEFVCDVLPTDATNFTKIAGIFLDDGSLFAVAKPPFAIPPSIRQTFKIQIVYQNISENINIEYISTDEIEQHASDIASMLFGADIRLHSLKDTTRIIKIEGSELR